jgi:hypothetical protein
VKPRDLHGRHIKWATSAGTIRGGIVWSDGPVQGTAWVIPDEPTEDEGHAVRVHLSSIKGHYSTVADERCSLKNAQDDALASMRFRQLVPSGFASAITKIGPHGAKDIRREQPMGFSLPRGL